MNSLILPQPNDFFIIKDEETGGVLCATTTHTIARAVARGFLNSAVICASSSLSHLRSIYDLDFNDLNQSLKLQSERFFVPLPASFDTAEWKETRKLALRREKFQAAWEAKCRKALQEKLGIYFNEPLLLSALNSVVSTDGAVDEWAMINQTSRQGALDEMRFLANSLNRAVLRNAALYDKYVHLINRETSYDAMMKTIEAGAAELFGTATA